MHWNKSIALAISLTGMVSLISAAAASEDGAKGIFFEQLAKPAEPINTGLRYWIELVRKGKTVRVSNKETFYSGDHIRFHVRPNVDGYAYILLRSGSRGEQSVLFPEEKSSDNNRMEHGRDYVLPGDGFLTFDRNPGTEKLTLLLSRTPIDATAYLRAPKEQPTVIASAVVGSKDLIPAKVMVLPPEPVANYAPPPPSHAVTVTHVPAKHPRTHSQTTLAMRHFDNEDERVVTTVVRKDPTGVLFIDVALNHK